MNTEKMLGKKSQPFCGSRCCGERGHRHVKNTKRTERQAWKKAVR